MLFQTKGQICLVMDLMGGDLHTYMKHYSSYCHQHGCRWTAQIALGLNSLHEIGMIHQDIKAKNILIDVQENVRIADFGLCYVKKEEGPLEPQWRYMASAVGTTYCMAPEVLCNRGNPDEVFFDKEFDIWFYVSWFPAF
ncbi:kinase-like domain-containing protein [Suillus subaureus]|uniref:non-specific serine/threonine protein kinase n=1 Tax=Suillus subaureus TaxID=48587 RepID=A0A9P7ATB1_9AGAM|nr:kinase-like domain-containing protein [Suillus subaureus]KAG1796190.1 kinase-like domain-containing protein [Suillus subaureus]